MISNGVKSLQKYLESAERLLLVLLFLVMVALAFLQVLLREFFSTGFLWADTFLRHLVLWVGFLGAAMAVTSSSHFVIDIIKKFLPEKAKRLSEIVIALFSLTVLALLFLAALKFLKYDIETKAILFSVGTLEVPAFWVNLILPLGFALVFTHYLLSFLFSFLWNDTTPSSTPLYSPLRRGKEKGSGGD